MPNPDETSPSNADGPPGPLVGREHPDPVRGQRIRDARNALRLTQQSLAVTIDRDPKSVSGWEQGKTISIDSLMKLADALNVSPDYIEFGTEHEAPLPELVGDELPSVPDLIAELRERQFDRIEEQLGTLLAYHTVDEEQGQTISERLTRIEDRITKLEEKNPYQAILRLLRLVEADRGRLGRDLGRRDLQGRVGRDHREAHKEGIA